MAERPHSKDGDHDGMWWALTTIKEDLDRLDKKWDSSLTTLTTVTANLEHVTQKVTELSKILTIDNGKPSVVTQLREAAHDRDTLKNLINVMQADVATIKAQTGYKLPAEVRAERIKAVSKLIGLAALITPGLLSFLHSFVQ